MRAPHKVGEAFTMTLADAARAAQLLAPPRPPAEGEADAEGENYRDVDGDSAGELAELAESINNVGQLQRVGMYWTGAAYRVAFGFRRIAAMWTHRDDFAFKRVKCERVEETQQDVARLVENFQRLNPTSYETARYMYQLHYGLRGPRRSVAELAQATGKSNKTISNLIRFYRVLPIEVREAWREDRDERFSFRMLAKLAIESQDAGADAAKLLETALGNARNGVVEGAAAPNPVIGTPEAPAEATAAEDRASEARLAAADPACTLCLGEGERFWHTPSCNNPACVLAGREEDCEGQLEDCRCTSRQAAPTAAEGAPPAALPSDGDQATDDDRRFGKRLAGRLARRLAGAGDRLKTDDRAPLVLELLEVVAGRRPVSHAEKLVARLLLDLGVSESPAKTGRRDLKAPSSAPSSAVA